MSNQNNPQATNESNVPANKVVVPASTDIENTPLSRDSVFITTHYEVGFLFVKQYYTVLNKNPESIHRFYTGNSCLVHGKEGESVQYCYGQKEIQTRINQFKYANASIQVSNVDVQASVGSSIILQVLGEVKNDSGPTQRFVQTFVLIEQPGGFSVANDMLRYLKEYPNKATSTPVADLEPEHVTKSEAAKVVEPVAKPIEETPVPETQPTIVPSETVVKTEATTTETAPAAPVAAETKPAATEPVKSGPPQVKSWANMVALNSANSAGPKGTVVSAQSKPDSTKTSSDSSKEENYACQIVFKNAVNLTKPQIHDVFAPYGMIRKVDINSGRVIVEFENPESASKSAEKGKFNHNGFEFQVSLNRPNPSSRGHSYSQSHTGVVEHRRPNSGNFTNTNRRPNNGNASPDRPNFDKPANSGNNRRQGGNQPANRGNQRSGRPVTDGAR